MPFHYSVMLLCVLSVFLITVLPAYSLIAWFSLPMFWDVPEGRAGLHLYQTWTDWGYSRLGPVLGTGYSEMIGTESLPCWNNLLWEKSHKYTNIIFPWRIQESYSFFKTLLNTYKCSGSGPGEQIYWKTKQNKNIQEHAYQWYLIDFNK